MVRLYKNEYDLYIKEALFEYEKLGYRQLKRIIDLKIDRELSFETYDNHIKKLIEGNYLRIINRDAKNGQKIFYCLSDITRQEIDLGILQYNHDKTYQQLQDIREIKIRIYYKILCTIAIKPPLLVVTPEYENYPGVTIKELSNEFTSVLEYWYIKLSVRIIKEALIFLENKGLVKKIKIDNEYRYILAYDELKDFVMECMEIFKTLVTIRYMYLWRVIRRPRLEERRIYEMFWNKDLIKQELAKLNEIRIGNKKSPKYRELKKEKKEWVDNFDFNIYHKFKQLENKYSVLFDKYPTITNLILDVYYPQFLRDEIKSITNKNKNKKYLEAKIASFCDAISLRS
jgi:hypothetical protein